MVPNGYLEARGKRIYEKYLKSKISCQTPFKSLKEKHLKIKNFLHNCDLYNVLNRIDRIWLHDLFASTANNERH
jgi:hypothetical protein